MKPVVNSYQPSMTEWFAAIGEEEESKAFRDEDNRKVDRLEVLYQIIGLPYERPEEMSARDLADMTTRFKSIIDERGDELCAIRLVPNKPELPKLRQRGVSIRQCYENWFLKQDINPDEYTAYICPHSETLNWSATIIVCDEKIYGEMIRGLHSQLTHGETDGELLHFEFDFIGWKWSKNDDEAQLTVQRMIELLRVQDRLKQRTLEENLDCEFSHDYLKGYFESTVWPDDKVYIIDYNRLLPKYLPSDWSVRETAEAASQEIRGVTAHPGKTSGRVRIVTTENIENAQIEDGEILVCDNTDVRYLPLMKKAGAIVTDRGGILSHAAIISRELGRPCIIGTKVASQVLHDGDEVEVDASKGAVRILKRL
ncbi:MAG: PEP-utilizing enzyme [Patescibacteria group bacterium]|nr:PEP-utilizing enzyme [Patescibacteria group bacterium]